MAGLKLKDGALDALKESAEWSELTGPQRAWLEAYLTSGDPFAATKTAYQSKSERHARIFSYQVRKSPRMVAALRFLERYGRRDKELLVAEAQRQLDAAEPGSVAAAKLVALLADLKRGVTPTREGPEAPADEKSGSQRFPVGAIVEQAGKRYRIEAVEIPNDL